MEPSCIYEQDWWLDAAAPGAWQRVEVRWDRVPVGSLSFAVNRRMGLRFIELPPLTRTAALWLRPPEGSPAHALTRKVSILSELVAQLPPHERFELALRADCDAALPFVMLNYPVACTYTFVAPAQAHGNGMHQKTRNVVNKAARELEVVNGSDLSCFLEVRQAQFGRRAHTPDCVVERMFMAAHSRGQASVMCATTPEGKHVASAVLLWDEQVLRYWLSARTDDAPSGAVALLITRAAALAREKGLAFDTDGVASHRSALFLAKFGFDPAVRPYVSSARPVWKLAHLVTSTLRGERDDRHYRF